MNIVSQNYVYEFKKYIKNEISQKIDTITSNIVDNILEQNNNKFLKIIASLQDNIKDLILDIISKAIEYFDKKFRNSKYRKDNYYINIKQDEREYDFVIGTLKFKRTYYSSKDKQEYFYFIDNLLGIEKYKRYNPITKSYIIDTVFKTNQKLGAEIVANNQATLTEIMSDKIDQKTVCRQTVLSWLKEWKVPMINYPPIDIKGSTLYVMADEKWIHEQSFYLENDLLFQKNKKCFIMSKCFVCFSGISQKGNRRTLEDKMVFLTSSNNPWIEFLDKVSTVYDFEKIENIVFLSDGGKWLEAGAYDLKLFPQNKVTMCLCEFHARQKINRITTDDDTRLFLNKCLNINDKKAFKAKLLELKQDKIKDQKRIKKITEYENYILNHWKKIQNMFKSKCRSSMESHISHCVASYFSSRPKAYSINNIEKYLKIQEYKMNGINIQKLYLNSYNNKTTVQLKKEELNFSIFENYSSNIEIFNYGKNSSLFKILTYLTFGS